MISMHQDFIPSGYKQVEYLQGQGNQWLNFGILPLFENPYIKLDFQYDDFPGITYDTVLSQGIYSPFNWLIVEASHRFLYWFGARGEILYNDSKRLKTRQTLEIIDKVYVYNDIFSFSKNIGTPYKLEHPLLLMWGNNTAGCAMIGKVYYLKVGTTKDNLIIDAIPCLDNNNRPCMYDTISKKAFYNQGTGEFLYGEVIN